MTHFHTLLAPTRRSLARQVRRLCDTLDHLGQQLREAVARAVGQNLADAVRDAIRTLWSDSPDRWESSYRNDPYSARSPSFWEDRDDSPWPEETDGLSSYDDEDRRDSEDVVPEKEERPGRLRQAVAFGLQAVAWLLRRRAQRFSVLTAVGVGLVCALASYAAGPGLIGSALSLTAVAGAVRSASTALGWFTPS